MLIYPIVWFTQTLHDVVEFVDQSLLIESKEIIPEKIKSLGVYCSVTFNQHEINFSAKKHLG